MSTMRSVSSAFGEVCTILVWRRRQCTVEMGRGAWLNGTWELPGCQPVRWFRAVARWPRAPLYTKLGSCGGSRKKRANSTLRRHLLPSALRTL